MLAALDADLRSDRVAAAAAIRVLFNGIFRGLGSLSHWEMTWLLDISRVPKQNNDCVYESGSSRAQLFEPSSYHVLVHSMHLLCLRASSFFYYYHYFIANYRNTWSEPS
jgi:hypothetical protein